MVRPGEARFTLWAKHDRVKRWLPLYTGVTQEWAIREMIIRQDRVRRTQTPCKFKVRPDGEKPDE